MLTFMIGHLLAHKLLLLNFIVVAAYTVTVQQDLVDPETYYYASSLCTRLEVL